MEPIPPRPSGPHRILMNFMCRQGWQISFLEADCCTPLRRRLTFATADKIIEMHQRWGERKDEDTLAEIERSIEMGRPGSIWLLLTEEQLQKLRA